MNPWKPRPEPPRFDSPDEEFEMQMEAYHNA